MVFLQWKFPVTTKAAEQSEVETGAFQPGYNWHRHEVRKLYRVGKSLEQDRRSALIFDNIVLLLP